jgi:putative tryptophan/tyrosine transport system substrate-binding protein
MSTPGQTRIGAQRCSHSGWRIGRREFMTMIGGSAIAWPLVARAQQPQSASPKRLGLLATSGCNNPVSRRLAELGWMEGRNYIIECVSTLGRLDQVPTLARELVSRRPDVLMAIPAQYVRALKEETTTIPIVMLSTPDPVRTGIVTNLAHPEGNVTGVAWFGWDILPKRIELLKEIVPHLRRLAIIRTAYGDPKVAEIIEENVTIAASTLGFAWQYFRPAVASDYDEIFARIAAEHFDAAYIQAGPFNNLPENGTRIVQLALRHMIPTVGELAGLAKGGLLVAYGQDFIRDFMQASEYVDKILRGTKPTELPVVQATNLQLVINLKTAKALGLTVPPSLLARADEVIE